MVMNTGRKKILFTAIILFVGVVGLSAGMSVASRFVHHAGLVDGRLKPCPDAPNCVCSEYKGVHAFPPLQPGTSADGGMSALRQAIEASGGRLRHSTPLYLWASYTTPIFRVIDDVEARLDPATGMLHLRSASRVGYYDFGANRKRLQEIATLFYQKLRKK